MGRRCTILMQEGNPLERGFGPLVGRWARRLLEEHGVEIVGEDELARYEGAGGRVSAVVSATGRELPADMVVIGAGVAPDVMLARAAGLRLGASGGIECDATLRSSADRVWAAGDVCEYDSVVHGRRLRVEHWEVAVAQGKHVARAIAGDEQPYREIPYFWSDIGDWATLEYVGPAERWDHELVRGSLEDGEFTVFYLLADRVVAAFTVRRSGDLDHARRLIASGAALGERAAALADPQRELGEVG
jgi:3-phenylpropionate/trans-cinnamate dioxygenase ferredoxin reductase subunit